ncbi:DUF2057 family protein [Yersinia ruckeri]|uniref:DUF2057 family protein n=1 Tax=Yersinia ruckeri TaxID=29486 RepID=UPI0011AAEFED|nr:DUF2057 family protein [Yersinia ruckeri]EKN3345096.1 DUF2057 family protein [Yersinia ruckeri]EKN4206844.1 DUF2057 family protein [Yersinia ruckeri]EKN4697286.1 DUF2057 family protein [Yersinia ruckeri]EKN4704592.1 DUF2057 family protein [Yersinia ruckeri]ELM3745886.1 DUF2057 family protein [Yersinia ruckeri]
MKIGLMAMGVLIACLSASALATTLKLSPEIDLLVVDGKNMSGSLLKGADSLELNSGQHQILFKVAKNLSDDASAQIFYTSPPLVVVFNTHNVKSVAIRLPAIANPREGLKFTRNPIYQLVDHNTHILPVRSDVLHPEDLSNSPSLENLMALYNLGNHKASVPSFASIPPSTTSAVPGTTLPAVGSNITDKTTRLNGENVSEQMLQYWFLQADKDTQKRFLDWAKKYAEK